MGGIAKQCVLVHVVYESSAHFPVIVNLDDKSFEGSPGHGNGCLGVNLIDQLLVHVGICTLDFDFVK